MYNTKVDFKAKRLDRGAFSYSGSLDGAIRFIEKHQLLDRELWRLVIQQFAIGNADDRTHSWKGEYWGKLMRGACMTYAYTQNEELYSVLEDAARGLLVTEDEYGRFSTYSRDCEFNGWDMWCRKYVLLGYEYFLEICKDAVLGERIIAAMKRHADYIMSHIGEGKKRITETSVIWQGLNSSSIMEPYVCLYGITGEKKYLDFAKYIIDEGGCREFDLFEDIMRDGVYPYMLPVTKAYEMMSCFEGIARYYLATGEQKYLDTVLTFAKKVMESDITIIGSAGCTHELFDHSVIGQFDPAYTGIMQETCVTVTWMKLCDLLYRITGDNTFIDHIERSAYNALLGSINTQLHKKDGLLPVVDSYSPLRKGFRGDKTGGFQWLIPGKAAYGCCVAIAAAGTALTALSSVYRTERGFAFTLYQKGTVCAKAPEGSEVEFEIDTDYPVSGNISVTVHTKEAVQMELDFRLPPYGKAIFTVNGAPEGTSRLWQDGDRVDIEIDMPLVCIRDTDISKDKKFGYAAFVKGPVVMALDERCNRGKADNVLCLNEGVQIEPVDRFELFPCRQAYTLRCGKDEYILVDYASAGKTWRPEDSVAAWIKADY